MFLKQGRGNLLFNIALNHEPCFTPSAAYVGFIPNYEPYVNDFTTTSDQGIS